MKDIDCCKDCKKRGTDCHGDVFYYNSSPICREFISDEPSVWEENTMLEEEIAALKEKYRWRKQSEELPKNNDIVQIWGRKYFELSFGYYNYKEKTWYERRHEDDDVECGEYIRYWRPLDLPEEENK